MVRTVLGTIIIIIVGLLILRAVINKHSSIHEILATLPPGAFDAPPLTDRDKFPDLHAKIDLELMNFLEKVGYLERFFEEDFLTSNKPLSRKDERVVTAVTVASNLRREFDKQILKKEIVNHTNNLNNPDPLLREIAKYLLNVTTIRLEMLERDR